MKEFPFTVGFFQFAGETKHLASTNASRPLYTCFANTGDWQCYKLYRNMKTTVKNYKYMYKRICKNVI